MANETVLRTGQKILGTLASGTGDPILTRDATTLITGSVTSIDSGWKVVGNTEITGDAYIYADTAEQHFITIGDDVIGDSPISVLTLVAYNQVQMLSKAGAVTITGASGIIVQTVGNLSLRGDNQVVIESDDQVNIGGVNDIFLGSNALMDVGKITSMVKHLFTADAVRPGINIGQFAGNPSTLVNGDMWYNSSTNNYMLRVSGTSVIGIYAASTVANRVPFYTTGGAGVLGSSSSFTCNGSTLSITNITITGTISANGSVGTAGQVLTSNGAGAAAWAAAATGDVVGPASSVDNTLVRFNGTTGKLLQTSGIVIDDGDSISGLNAIQKLDADDDTVSPLLILRLGASATPDEGIGASILFSVETAANQFKTGSSIESVVTDLATPGAEDFDMVFRTMAAGTEGGERLRLSDSGAEIPAAAAFYLGPRNTNGSWRIIQSGDDLIFQQREAGSYVTKSTISGA